MDLSRRKLLGIGACLIAAPAIVRASSLMEVRALPPIAPRAIRVLFEKSGKHWWMSFPNAPYPQDWRRAWDTFDFDRANRSGINTWELLLPGAA